MPGMDLPGGMVSELAGLLGRTGPAAPAILFAASLAEYVFPPFPGDLLVVLGAWYAVQGAISWPLAFTAVTGGAVAGAALDHAVGRWLGSRLDVRVARRGALSAERLARFVDAYRRHGAALLLLNRFLPGVRAFVFVAAGAVGIRWGACSSWAASPRRCGTPSCSGRGRSWCGACRSSSTSSGPTAESPGRSWPGRRWPRWPGPPSAAGSGTRGAGGDPAPGARAPALGIHTW